jgi:hypothetical protein
MLIFRGGAVSRNDLSPSELQAHVEKWYRWSDELAWQGDYQRIPEPLLVAIDMGEITIG